MKRFDWYVSKTYERVVGDGDNMRSITEKVQISTSPVEARDGTRAKHKIEKLSILKDLDVRFQHGWGSYSEGRFMVYRDNIGIQYPYYTLYIEEDQE